MQVIHPAAPWQGISPEDIYDVVNDQGVQCGRGYVICNYQPAIYPERPVRIYFTMECTPDAEYMLFGALIGHARQRCQQYPHAEAYFYTDVKPQDTRLLNFCLHNGLSVGNAEELVRLHVPEDGGPDTFNCTFAAIPLNTVQQQSNLINNMARNGLGHITLNYLQQLAANTVFVALGLFIGNSYEPAAECIISGAPGREPELVGLYVDAFYRKQGYGTKLLRRALSLCAPSGVRSVQARIMSASQPQARLMRHFGGEPLCQTLLFPGMELRLPVPDASFPR